MRAKPKEPAMNNSDRLPPHSRPAERAILGAMLRDEKIIPDVVMILAGREFYVHAHAIVFATIAALNAQGKEANVVTVAEALTASRQMEEVGGHAYLADLWDSSPSTGAFRQYADAIRDAWTRRDLGRAASEIAGMVHDLATPAAEILDEAERRILDIAETGASGEVATMQDALKEEMTRLDRRHRGGDVGVPTGFLDLDDILCGLQNSELIVIGARPSVGKSQLALMIAAHAAVDEKLPVLFTSLEQSRIELAERLLVVRGKIDSHTLRRGHLQAAETERLMLAHEQLSGAKLFFDDTPGQGMLRISANARRMKRRHKIRMVIVDYLQLITPSDGRQPRNEQLGDISRRLKLLARELEIPVVALAQLNRESEGPQGSSVPRLSQLGGSDNIGQDADTVILLHRLDDCHLPNTPIPDKPTSELPAAMIDVIVEKNRNGRRGLVHLMFEKRFMTFHNHQTDPDHSRAHDGDLPQ